ncbi:MAG TPA: hypothetical protein VMB50_19770, partial [Myxococcales bacterium]|nr:hypothetical protein [Myxococcales bacterium]
PPGILFAGPFELEAFSGNDVLNNAGDQMVIDGPGNWPLEGGSCSTFQPTGNGFGYTAGGTGAVGLRVTAANAVVDAEFETWFHDPPEPGIDYAVDAGFSSVDATNPCTGPFPP